MKNVQPDLIIKKDNISNTQTLELGQIIGLYLVLSASYLCNSLSSSLHNSVCQIYSLNLKADCICSSRSDDHRVWGDHLFWWLSLNDEGMFSQMQISCMFLHVLFVHIVPYAHSWTRIMVPEVFPYRLA